MSRWLETPAHVTHTESGQLPAGFSALLQAHRTAARPEAMVRRFDIV